MVEKCQHTGPREYCILCRPEAWRWTEKEARAYTIAWLVNEITTANAKYRRGEDSGYRDEEFDALERSLKAYAPEHPILQKVGTYEEDP